jgi:hypothetical protein
VLGSPPPVTGTTQVVWQLADEELHNIMQVVTAEVTVVVCGGTAVVLCADAGPGARTAVPNTAETANTIAMRRIVTSPIARRAFRKLRATIIANEDDTANVTGKRHQNVPAANRTIQ